MMPIGWPARGKLSKRRFLETWMRSERTLRRKNPVSAHWTVHIGNRSKLSLRNYAIGGVGDRGERHRTHLMRLPR